MNILAVCSGNTCRSPMAEGIFRALFARHQMRGEVRSSGTLGLNGERPSMYSVMACAEIDIDISELRSSAVTDEDLVWADAVLCLAPQHFEHVLSFDQVDAQRVHLLGPFDAFDRCTTIADPIGSDLPTYREVRDRIRRAAEGFLRHAGILEDRKR